MENQEPTNPIVEPLQIKKKKGTKWKAILGLIVIVVMVGSGFILAGSGTDEEELPENAFQVSGYTFYETPEGDFGALLLSDQGTQIPIVFRADPRNLSDIYMDEDVPTVIKTASKVYLAYNPNQQNLSKAVVAASQVSRIIPLTNGYRPVLAYLEDTDPVDETIPIKSCADAVNGTVMILFEVTGKTDIVNENNCIHVRGKDHDELMIAADKLGMNLVGISL